jgi:hypothetical protein
MSTTGRPEGEPAPTRFSAEDRPASPVRFVRASTP